MPSPVNKLKTSHVGKESGMDMTTAKKWFCRTASPNVTDLQGFRRVRHRILRFWMADSAERSQT